MYRKYDSNMHKQCLSVYYTFPRPILPFHNSPIQVSYVSQYTRPFLSCSMYNYLSELKNKAVVLGEQWLYYNSYMWLYIPTSIKNISISNIKIVNQDPLFIHQNIILYELIEMANVLRIFIDPEFISYKHYGKNYLIYEKSIQSIRNMYSKNSEFKLADKIDCITIDATNENDNEYDTAKTALIHICQALTVQSKNGILILKIGDCFTQLSLDMIYLVSSFYEKSYFMKPTVSFLASSTRYIVCKDFRYDKLTTSICDRLHLLQEQINMSFDSRYILRILNFNIPVMFSNKLEEINSILGQPRLEYIHQCLNQFEQNSERPVQTIPNDIRKCVDWCTRFKVPIQSVYKSSSVKTLP